MRLESGLQWKLPEFIIKITNFKRFSNMKLTDVEMYVITSNPEMMIKESYF